MKIFLRKTWAICQLIYLFLSHLREGFGGVLRFLIHGAVLLGIPFLVIYLAFDPHVARQGIIYLLSTWIFLQGCLMYPIYAQKYSIAYVLRYLSGLGFLLLSGVVLSGFLGFKLGSMEYISIFSLMLVCIVFFLVFVSTYTYVSWSILFERIYWSRHENEIPKIFQGLAKRTKKEAYMDYDQKFYSLQLDDISVGLERRKDDVLSVYRMTLAGESGDMDLQLDYRAKGITLISGEKRNLQEIKDYISQYHFQNYTFHLSKIGKEFFFEGEIIPKNVEDWQRWINLFKILIK